MSKVVMSDSYGENKAQLNKDKEYVINLIFSNVQTMTLNSALHMKLFEALHKRWLTIEEISETSPFHPPTKFLPELCDTLTTMNLIAKRKNEDGKAVYSNKHAVDKYCRRQSPFSINTMCRFNAEISKPLVEKIRPSVINGSYNINTYEITEKDKEFRELFQSTMTEVCNTSKQLVTAFDLSQFKSTIDLGGGTGTFSRFVRHFHPEMEITVVELPKIVELALTIPANKTNNIKYITGSFFEKLPPADLYCLCHVLHNWSDSECDDILSNVIDSLNPGGAVLVLDSVMNVDRVGPLKLNLVEVMQMAMHSGSHRTLVGYQTILRRNGFVRFEHKKADDLSFYDAMIGFKP